MKFLKISSILMIFFSVFTSNIFAENSVTVSQIQGLDTARGLMTEVPIRYYIHFKVGEQKLDGIFNSFIVYSPDNANWQPLALTQTIMLSQHFDQISGFFKNGVDGFGNDTVAVHGYNIFGQGIPQGFDSNVFFIETRLSNNQIGKTLCLDSASASNGITGFWLWDATPDPDIQPTWDGPHCYEIVDCCDGRRGDVNGDGVGPNTLDLQRLIDYLFRGLPAPLCSHESDVNGDGMPNRINDLTYIVDFMFRGGPMPPNCP